MLRSDHILFILRRQFPHSQKKPYATPTHPSHPSHGVLWSSCTSLFSLLCGACSCVRLVLPRPTSLRSNSTAWTTAARFVWCEWMNADAHGPERLHHPRTGVHQARGAGERPVGGGASARCGGCGGGMCLLPLCATYARSADGFSCRRKSTSTRAGRTTRSHPGPTPHPHLRLHLQPRRAISSIRRRSALMTASHAGARLLPFKFYCLF